MKIHISNIHVKFRLIFLFFLMSNISYLSANILANYNQVWRYITPGISRSETKQILNLIEVEYIEDGNKINFFAPFLEIAGNCFYEIEFENDEIIKASLIFSKSDAQGNNLNDNYWNKNTAKKVYNKILTVLNLFWGKTESHELEEMFCAEWNDIALNPEAQKCNLQIGLFKNKQNDFIVLITD